MKSVAGSGLKAVLAAVAFSTTILTVASSWAAPTFQYNLLRSDVCTMGVSEYWWQEDPQLPHPPMANCGALMTQTCTDKGGKFALRNGKATCTFLKTEQGSALNGKTIGQSGNGPTIPAPAGGK